MHLFTFEIGKITIIQFIYEEEIQYRVKLFICNYMKTPISSLLLWILSLKSLQQISDPFLAKIL